MKRVFLSLIFLSFSSVEINAQFDRTINNPVQNFEEFWELFNNNYAFFEEKNINWDSIGQTHRPTVNAKTSNEILFHTFCTMLKSLNDAHVNLIVKEPDTTFSAERHSRLLEELKPIRGNVREGFGEMVKTTLDKNRFKNVKSLGKNYRGIPLFWYGDNNKVGYLRVGRSFTSRIFKKGLRLERQLNTIFKSFDGLEAIIIDIRLNPGGTDSFSKSIVNRLTDKKIVGYYKQTRKDREFGELDTHYIIPKGKYKFLKPVYLLTNDRTISAADVMALMMQDLKNVTILGENSNGSYSDIYAKKLSNKWMVTLSNQKYLSVNKENYEGIGTPVDLEVKNKLENYTNKNDLILSKAIELISKRP